MNMPWPRLRENKNILICSVQFLICFAWQWHWLGRLVLMSINIIPFSLSNNFQPFRFLVFPFLKTFHLGLFHIFAFDVMTLKLHICYLKSVLFHEKWCKSPWNEYFLTSIWNESYSSILMIIEKRAYRSKISDIEVLPCLNIFAIHYGGLLDLNYWFLEEHWFAALLFFCTVMLWNIFAVFLRGKCTRAWNSSGQWGLVGLYRQHWLTWQIQYQKSRYK